MDPRSHATIRELLPRYAAHQLTPSERATVERHTATCADCRAELREWLTLGEWLAEDEATIPLDTGSARGLAAIHARLRQPSESDGFERSALSTMSNQDSPRDSTDQDETQPSPTLRERSPSTTLPGGLSSRPYPPQPPHRRISPVVAGTSVAVFLALVASLFYLLAPQLGPHRTAISPTATAMAQATATPKPLSGSWHTAQNTPEPLTSMQFSTSTPQIGYLCTNTSPIPASSSQWLYKSDDGGMTWRPVGGIMTPTVSQSVSMTCSISIDTSDANDVFVQLLLWPGPGLLPVVSKTLWRSRDGGITWSKLSIPQTMLQGWASIVVVGSRLVGLGSESQIVPPICTTDPHATAPHQVNDLFASDDGGLTWTQIGQALINQGLSISRGAIPGPIVLSVGTVLYVKTSCGVWQSNGEYLAQQAYWKSSDGGGTWTRLPIPASVIGDLDFMPSATGGVYGVAVNVGDTYQPEQSEILYSRDSGASWETLPSLKSLPLLHTATRIYAQWVIALPDGSVLANISSSSANASDGSSDMYAIDPQSPKPAWRHFVSTKVDSTYIAPINSWPGNDRPLATTKRGLVLWAQVFGGQHNLTTTYLSPLP